MGNVVGRDGTGVKATTTYWFAPDRKLIFSYRNSVVNPEFIYPGGGKLHDAFVGTEWAFTRQVNIKSSIQYERWHFPVLASGWQNNITYSFQVVFQPVQKN